MKFFLCNFLYPDNSTLEKEFGETFRWRHWENIWSVSERKRGNLNLK